MNNDNFQSLEQEQKTLLLNQIYRLLSEISHELKSPLGTTLTAATNLTKRSLDLQSRFETDSLTRNDLSAFLELVYESSKISEENIKRANTLIEKFGSLTKLQTGYEKTNFNLYTHLENIISSLSPRLSRANVDISLSGDKELEVRLCPEYFFHILDNLILNSVNHGFSEMDEGQIEIEFFMEGDNLIINYTDNGSGIPEALRIHIFEDNHSTSEKTGGTGLGMSIVHSLISREMGGSITAEPVMDSGSHFYISIPV